jgi:hypothetical protein
MKVHKYKSYAAYRAAQVKANRDKIALSWVRPEVVGLVCDRILAAAPAPAFGLCHGTRRGEEQQLFKSRLKCQVVGTEISPTAADFPDTIEWDFQEVKAWWIGECDFIYSNSLDHAKNPARALAAWVSCLKPTGVLAVEWVELLAKGRVKTATAMDPVSATVKEVCALIEKAGGEVTEVLPLKIPLRKSFLIFARRRS